MTMLNKQKPKTNSDSAEVLRGILYFQLIVVSQVAVVAMIALVVLFINGFAQYFYWIVFGGGTMVLLTAALMYHRIKKNGLKSVNAAIRSPELRGRDVEVRVLGGLVSVKLGSDRRSSAALEDHFSGSQLKLEDPETLRIRELTDLGRLLERNLISLDEFKRSKARIMDN